MRISLLGATFSSKALPDGIFGAPSQPVLRPVGPERNSDNRSAHARQSPAYGWRAHRQSENPERCSSYTGEKNQQAAPLEALVLIKVHESTSSGKAVVILERHQGREESGSTKVFLRCSARCGLVVWEKSVEVSKNLGLKVRQAIFTLASMNEPWPGEDK